VRARAVLIIIGRAEATQDARRKRSERGTSLRDLRRGRGGLQLDDRRISGNRRVIDGFGGAPARAHSWRHHARLGLGRLGGLSTNCHWLWLARRGFRGFARGRRLARRGLHSGFFGSGSLLGRH
jgi:hypothetical protein